MPILLNNLMRRSTVNEHPHFHTVANPPSARLEVYVFFKCSHALCMLLHSVRQRFILQTLVLQLSLLKSEKGRTFSDCHEFPFILVSLLKRQLREIFFSDFSSSCSFYSLGGQQARLRFISIFVELLIFEYESAVSLTSLL
jgi:hypothetical protein